MIKKEGEIIQGKNRGRLLFVNKRKQKNFLIWDCGVEAA
jgi:hypothetical protein